MDDAQDKEVSQLRMVECQNQTYWQWVADQIHAYNSVVRGQRTGGCHETE